MRMFLIALLALMSSASRCFRDPCEGKWSDASSFDVRGVEWVGNKAGVLGVFTKREKCPNLLGYTYRTLYSRDVMFFVDPSTIHQDERGLWVVEADSVWIIHQEPSIGGGDLWKDPRGRGWWLGRYLYDDAFNRILDSLPCGYHTYPVGDTLYYLCFTGTDATPDTVGRKILSTGQSEPLFTYPIVGLLAADPLGRIYITGGNRLLRWEGVDSFTVIDSGPIDNFGFKGDTLVISGSQYFHFLLDTTYLKSVPREGPIPPPGIWKWNDNMPLVMGGKVRAIPYPPEVCKPVQQGGYQCAYIKDFYLISFGPSVP